VAVPLIKRNRAGGDDRSWPRSEPEALLAVLRNPAYRFKRIGLEAGPLSQLLFSALAEAGLLAVCVETRHMQAVLKAQINKTDRNDARGIAQMIRVGISASACEDAAQSETTDAADASCHLLPNRSSSSCAVRWDC